MESSSGVSQQGRVRDDFGNWFGCNNSVLLWHFPLPEKYLRRNLNVAAPEPSIHVVGDPDPNALFPISYTLERFNNPNSANRTTSACGVEIYRDDLLGENFYDNSFVCEPVHNLVHRYLLEKNGVTFAAHRPADEQRNEFLASTDNWFRPVETRTGPDGALWIVDMYRFVIEHPMWIPAERLAKLDVRAGDDKGRIYRVYPKDATLHPIRDLTKIKTAKLVALLETSNGTERDLIHRELYQRANVLPSSTRQNADRPAIEPLKKLFAATKNPAVKVQALSALDGLKALPADLVIAALNDSNEGVRENAIRLSEPFLRANNETVGDALVNLASDSEYRIQFQLALSLGEWNNARAGKLLGEMAKQHLGDAWMRAAILSSASQFPGEILQSVLTLSPETRGRNETVSALIATAAASENPHSFEATLIAIAPEKGKTISSWQLEALASLQEALQRKNLSLDSFANSSNEKLREAIASILSAINDADKIASDKNAPPATREAAVSLLSSSTDEDALRTLINLATQTENAKLQKNAQNSLRLQKSAKLPELLLAGWTSYPVSVRSGILEILLSRDEGMRKVLDGVEQGLIKPAEVPISKRQALLKHADEKIRQRAIALFPQNQDRAKVLAKFSDVPKLSGDSERGAQVFTKLCVSCHSFKGQGVAVGPDLMPLGDKTPQDFLLAILDPSSAIEPRFIQYNIETKDGRSLSGIIRAETAGSLTLVQGGGVEEKILRSDIVEKRASNLSLMPEGLEEGNTSQNFADLIAYLKARPARFGSATTEQAEAAGKKFVASGANGFAQLVFAFENLEYPSWMGKLPMPYCRQTDGKSKVVWKSAPAPNDLKADAFYDFRLAAGFGLISAKSGKFVLNVNGKPALNFNVTLNDASWQSKDGSVVMRYHVLENNSEDSNGVLTISLRGDLLKPGEPVNFEAVGSATNSQRWFGIYSVSETRTAKAN
jgi:putative heme-binding domain-containing protein